MVNRTFNPVGEALSLREAMNQLLEGSFIRPGTTLLAAGGTTAFSFPLNAWVTADELKVEALLPGFSEEDVNVDIDRGVLTIAAKRHGWDQADGERWYLREFHPGEFTRSLSLPFLVDVEHANASFANGVLTLTLPKSEAAKPRRIQIGGGQREYQRVIEGQAEQKQPNGTAES